jgi:DNA-binding protein
MIQGYFFYRKTMVFGPKNARDFAGTCSLASSRRVSTPPATEVIVQATGNALTKAVTAAEALEPWGKTNGFRMRML